MTGAVVEAGRRRVTASLAGATSVERPLVRRARYRVAPSPERPQNEHALVARYLPLVRKIAARVSPRIPPSLELEDVIQAGAIGLLEAIRGYDSARGASFTTFAGVRIHGAMMDEIRRELWAPRSVFRQARLIDQAKRDVENASGRRASAREVADRLGVSTVEFGELCDGASARSFARVDTVVENHAADDSSGPLERIANAWFAESLGNAVAQLPERERAVMEMYYVEDLKLHEIGRRLGLTESRICQLRRSAVDRLKDCLCAWREENAVAAC